MVSYQEGLTLPVPVLLHLYDVMERMKLDDRAAATDDHRAVAGTHSKEHHEALMQRIDAFERLAAGEPLPGYTGDTSKFIEL